MTLVANIVAVFQAVGGDIKIKAPINNPVFTGTVGIDTAGTAVSKLQIPLNNYQEPGNAWGPNAIVFGPITDSGDNSGGFGFTYKDNVGSILMSVSPLRFWNSLNYIGSEHFFRTSGWTPQFHIGNNSTGINYIGTKAANINSDAIIYAEGADASIGLKFLPKGNAKTSLFNVFIYGQASNTDSNAVTACLKPNGTSSDEKAVLSLYSTFKDIPTDILPRRTADIVTGFENKDSNGNPWGQEYLSFHVGSGGASNDNQLLTKELFRLTASGRALFGPPSAPHFTVEPISNQTSYLYIRPASNNYPVLGVAGTNTNIGIDYYVKGLENHRFFAAGGIQFQIGATTNPVNWLLTSGGQTGNPPTFYAVGSDANIGLNFIYKNAAVVYFASNSPNVDGILRIGRVGTGASSIDIQATSGNSKIHSYSGDLILSTQDTNACIRFGSAVDTTDIAVTKKIKAKLLDGTEVYLLAVLV